MICTILLDLQGGLPWQAGHLTATAEANSTTEIGSKDHASMDGRLGGAVVVATLKTPLQALRTRCGWAALQGD